MDAAADKSNSTPDLDLDEINTQLSGLELEEKTSKDVPTSLEALKLLSATTSEINPGELQLSSCKSLSQSSASHAPAPPSLKRARKNCLSIDYYPSELKARLGRSPYVPPEKRQKTFDYHLRDCADLFKAIIRTSPYSEAITAAQLYLIYTKYPIVNFSPPSYLQRLLENAFGFTPLDHGAHLYGWHFNSAHGFPDLFTSPNLGDFSNLFKICPFHLEVSYLEIPNSAVERPIPRILTSTARRFDPLRLSYELYRINKRKEFQTKESKMATAGDSQLFDEHFTVTSFDQSKYDRVARIGGTSGDSQTVMTLDINIELYPCAVGDNLHVVLANSLSLDGSKDDGKGWRDVSRNGPGGETTLADMFDYVCHGKIYKFEDGENGDSIKAYISFGGLLMALEGPYKKLTPLRVDYVYLLVKK